MLLSFTQGHMCGGNAERDPLCQSQCVRSHGDVGLFPKNVIYVDLLDTQGLPAMTSHNNYISFTQGPLRVNYSTCPGGGKLQPYKGRYHTKSSGTEHL